MLLFYSGCCRMADFRMQLGIGRASNLLFLPASLVSCKLHSGWVSPHSLVLIPPLLPYPNVKTISICPLCSLAFVQLLHQTRHILWVFDCRRWKNNIAHNNYVQGGWKLLLQLSKVTLMLIKIYYYNLAELSWSTVHGVFGVLNVDWGMADQFAKDLCKSRVELCTNLFLSQQFRNSCTFTHGPQKYVLSGIPVHLIHT